MPVGELVSATVVALPAVNSALTLIERLSKLVKGNAGLEMQEAVLQLREVLLSVKEENLVLKQDKLSLAEEISALRKSISHKSQLRFKYPNYYLISETGQKDGPFCKSCQDNHLKMSPVKNPTFSLFEVFAL